MKAQETRTLVHRWVDEVLNPGDLDRADDLIALDFLDHDVPPGQTLTGLAGFKQGAAGVRATFPDIQATVEDVVAAGDKIAFRLTLRGTHRGTIAGIPPTGKEVTYSGIGIVRVADGKIAERWLRVDIPAVVRQIGGYFGPQPPRPE
jgi:steroid delta-isomerase-like uncharacterized protein